MITNMLLCLSATEFSTNVLILESTFFLILYLYYVVVSFKDCANHLQGLCQSLDDPATAKNGVLSLLYMYNATDFEVQSSYFVKRQIED